MFIENKSAVQDRANPERPENQNDSPCKNCPWLKKLQAENQQIGKEIDTVLTAMEMIFSIMQLRDLSASGVKEDINKELSEGKEKVRTLFNNLIETGEPAFVDRFFRALNLPKDFQHLI